MLSREASGLGMNLNYDSLEPGEVAGCPQPLVDFGNLCQSEV